MPNLLRILKQERTCAASNAVVLINAFGELEFMFTWFWQKPNTSDNRRVNSSSLYEALSATWAYQEKQLKPYYLVPNPTCQHGYDNTVTRAAPFLKSKGYRDDQINFNPYTGVILSGIDLKDEAQIQKAADALWEFWQTLKEEIEEGKKPLRNVDLNIEINYITLDDNVDTPYFSILEKEGKKHLLRNKEFELILSLHGKGIDKSKLRKYMERETISLTVSEQEAEEIRSLKNWTAMRGGWYKKYYYPKDLYII